MNPEIKQKWIEALRSGKYNQGTGCLRTYKNEFCCWGVLCDLHSKKNGDVWHITPLMQDGEGKYAYYNEKLFAPKNVLKWAGFSDSILISMNEPLVSGSESDKCFFLSSLNDAGKTFSEIADIIEKNL